MTTTPPRRAWSAEHVQLLREMYGKPTVSVAQIARLVCRTEKQVMGKACSLGITVRPKDRAKMAPPTVQQLRLLVAGDRAQGFAVADISGMDPEVVGKLVTRMVAAGSLFRAKLSHKVVRYFTKAEAAQRYEASNRRPDRAAGSVSIRASHSHAWWPADAEPFYTSDTKRTVAPPLPERVLRTNTHSQL